MTPQNHFSIVLASYQCKRTVDSCPRYHDIAQLSFQLINQLINLTLASRNIDISDLCTLTLIEKELEPRRCPKCCST